jgi:response regulator RpfG family c-di-GMP phosphodiesterase
MKNFLIIEDDLIDQMALVRMLEQQNLDYQYSIAKSIQATKMELAQTSFDLVITDYNLADGTTFDLLDDLKHTPFILITGNEDQSTINSVKSKLGAIAYFTKDLDLNYLQELPIVIKQFFNQRIKTSRQSENVNNSDNSSSLISHQNVTINLKNVYKIFDGKKQEIKESIELFIFHKPREMENLYNYINNQDCESVVKVTHLMKSGFRIFGMKKQIELADYIEKNAGFLEKMCTCDKIIDSFKQLSTDTKIAIELLKKELPLL